MKKGFTLVELMVVLGIITILTTLAMPSYAKYTEKSYGKNAEGNLTVIYNMEKRIKMDNGGYYECAQSPCPGYSCPAPAGCSSSIINTGLGLFIRDTRFTYKIERLGASGYKATATRLAIGPCSGKDMTITDAGSVITKNCSVW
jgi:prepilin-type N-terminal cleavage/methylation domain-containing protein